MKAREIREKNEAELREELLEKQTKLAQLRFDVSANQHKNHRELKETKKEIARIKTVLGETKENKKQ